MKLKAPLFIIAFVTLVTGLAVSAADKPLLGFLGDRGAEQRELEARFDSYLRSENLRDWMKRLSARPHHVGSPYGREIAEFLVS